MRFILRILLLLLALGPPAVIGADAGVVSLFVSILPQKYITERIGGEHVDVQAMVAPGASPATYEPTPRQMTRLTEVDIYYRVGVPFERAWMERIRAVNPRMKVLDARDGIPLLAMLSSDRHGHDHNHNAMDPHIWLSPSRLKMMARRLKEELQRFDPSHGEAYQRNFESLWGELEALDAELGTIFGGLASRNFMVFHPSWGYFADDYGLMQVPIEVEGKEPGARALARLIESARKQGVRTVFVERQFSQDRARALAREIGAKIVVLDPLTENCIDNLRSVARSIAEAVYE